MTARITLGWVDPDDLVEDAEDAAEEEGETEAETAS